MELAKTMAFQNSQLKKLRVDANMQYELILALARSSYFEAIRPKVSIGYGLDIGKEEGLYNKSMETRTLAMLKWSTLSKNLLSRKPSIGMF